MRRDQCVEIARSPGHVSVISVDGWRCRPKAGMCPADTDGQHCLKTSKSLRIWVSWQSRHLCRPPTEKPRPLHNCWVAQPSAGAAAICCFNRISASREELPALMSARSPANLVPMRHSRAGVGPTRCSGSSRSMLAVRRHSQCTATSGSGQHA